MQQIFYKVLCMLYKDTGLILDGSCTYKASAMGRCSHISTLLFSMEDYIVNNGNMPVACTSQCCTWNKGAPIKTSVEVMAKQYSNKRDVSHIKEFHPLPDNSTPGAKVNALLRSCQEMTKNTFWQDMLEYQE
jgi:hypothetical protein